jgi:hypothetical protein
MNSRVAVASNVVGRRHGDAEQITRTLDLPTLNFVSSLLHPVDRRQNAMFSARSVCQFPRARGYAQAATACDHSTPRAVRHPYFIQRNSRGSIPVYTDVRNAGTRYLVLIRNVEGNVNVRGS